MNKVLEYVPGDSVLHRMNPVAKLAFALVFTVGWLPVFLVCLAMLVVWTVVAVALMRRAK